MYKLKVFYEDTDAGGVVYYANYLKFIERARTQILLDNGLTNIGIKKKLNIIFVVKSCTINYIKPAKLDDLLTVSTSILSKTKVKIVLNQVISRENQRIIDANVDLISVNLIGKPVRMPSEFINIFI